MKSKNPAKSFNKNSISKQSLLMTIPEVMDDLRISRSTVYNLITEKNLVAVKVRMGTRIKRASVEMYIEQNTLEVKNAT